MRLVTWLAVSALLAAGVPCGAWPAFWTDCCPEPLTAAHETVAPAGAATHQHHASVGDAPVAPVRTAHQHPAPAGSEHAASTAECCVSAVPAPADKAPRVTAPVFVLHPPSAEPHARLVPAVVAAVRVSHGPLPPAGTSRHVLLSTFRI